MTGIKAWFSKLSFSTQVLVVVIPIVLVIGLSLELIAYKTISYILLEIIQTEKIVAQNSIWKQLSYVQQSQGQMLNAFENSYKNQMRTVNRLMLLELDGFVFQQDLSSSPNKYINMITLNLTNLNSIVDGYYRNYNLIQIVFPLVFNDGKMFSVEMIFWFVDNSIYSHFKYDLNFQSYIKQSDWLWYKQWQYIIMNKNKKDQNFQDFSIFSQVLQNMTTSICKTIGLFDNQGNLIGAICSQLDQNKYYDSLKQLRNYFGTQYITSEFGAFMTENGGFDYFFNENTTGFNLEDFEIIVNQDTNNSNCLQAHNVKMVCRYNKKLQMDTLIQITKIPESQTLIINIVTQQYYDDFVESFYLGLYQELLISLTRYLIIFLSLVTTSIFVLFVLLRRLTKFSQSLKYYVFHKELSAQIKSFENKEINQYSNNHSLNQLISAYEKMLKQCENSNYKQSNVCKILQNQQVYSLNNLDKTGYQYIIEPISGLHDHKSIGEGIEVLNIPEVRESFQEQIQ